MVFKIGFQDATASPAGGYDVFVFVDPAGTQQAPGFTQAGAPTRFANFGPAVPSTCILDGSAGYCVLPYDTFAGVIGGKLTNVFATGYVNAGGSAAGDSGPCPGPLASCLAMQIAGEGGYGTDYTLTGCTKIGGCASVVPGGAGQVAYTDLTTPKLLQSFSEPSNGTFLYNVTNTLSNLNIVYSSNGTGAASVVVTDALGAVKLNQTLTGSEKGTVAVPAAALGNWTYRVAFSNFTGTFALDLVAPAASGTSASASATGSGSSSASGSASASATDAGGSSSAAGGASSSTSADGKKTPGFGLLLGALALGLVLVSRRRLT
ncbi:MAG: hypothetical protein AABX89_03325 [Candidatus Thermoplasmatota archaeon]